MEYEAYEGGSFVLFFDFLAMCILLILAFAAMGLSRLFARSSGWNAIAVRYRASYQPEGATVAGQHCGVGSVRYRSCTTIGISPAGLYLAVTAPVIGEHPPLLIPWSDVSSVKPARLYKLRALRLGIGEPQITTVTVLNNIFEEMQPYLSRWLPDSYSDR